MYNKNLKLIIAALIIAYAVYQFTEGILVMVLCISFISNICISYILKMNLFY